MNKNEIFKKVKEEEIEFIQLQFIDIFWNIKTDNYNTTRIGKSF